MSDYSDYEGDVIDSPQSTTSGTSEDPKRHARVQHNSLERRRRDSIKDMYSALREAVPEMNDERASRAVILKKTIDAIDLRTKRNISLSEEKKRIDEENRVLQEEIAKLERKIQDTVSNNQRRFISSGHSHSHLQEQCYAKVAPKEPLYLFLPLIF